MNLRTRMFLGWLSVAAVLLPDAAISLAQVNVIPSDTLPARKGERCMVCGAKLDSDDVALIVRGRRVPLDQSMVKHFMDNPEKYFNQKQPKSVLFQEELGAPEGVALGGISWGWFLFGSYVLVALLFAGLSGYVAVSKGLEPIRHFFIGFIFSVFGFLYVLTRPSRTQAGEVPAGLVKVPSTAAPVVCPHCGHTNHPSARNCSACKAKLEPLAQSEVSRAFS